VDAGPRLGLARAACATVANVKVTATASGTSGPSSTLAAAKAAEIAKDAAIGAAARSVVLRLLGDTASGEGAGKDMTQAARRPVVHAECYNHLSGAHHAPASPDTSLAMRLTRPRLPESLALLAWMVALVPLAFLSLAGVAAQGLGEADDAASVPL
jgi:hypothetical protein